VRSAFELLLDALAFDEGSEVLLSAITHPDMVRIVSRHGLVPVPVDLDLETLKPRLRDQAVTERTRALVVAHLFGARVDLDEAIGFCRRHGLVLIEDCAQTLRSARDTGDARTDAALFSFGSIKTAPALGGAIAYLRDPAVRERMRRAQESWPAQGRKEYALRIVRFAGLLALGHPWVYEVFVRAGSRAGLDVDALVNRSVHALKPPSSDHRDEFGEWLRRRPSSPLLTLLRRRLRTFDSDRLARRAERGEAAARSLPPRVFQPGRAAGGAHALGLPDRRGRPEGDDRRPAGARLRCDRRDELHRRHRARAGSCAPDGEDRLRSDLPRASGARVPAPPPRPRGRASRGTSLRRRTGRVGTGLGRGSGSRPKFPRPARGRPRATA
jgi:hypothetical protein